MGRRGKRYSEEYKASAVKLVLEDGLSVTQASQDLGLGNSTLAENIVLYYQSTALSKV